MLRLEHCGYFDRLCCYRSLLSVIIFTGFDNYTWLIAKSLLRKTMRSSPSQHMNYNPYIVGKKTHKDHDSTTQ